MLQQRGIRCFRLVLARHRFKRRQKARRLYQRRRERHRDRHVNALEASVARTDILIITCSVHNISFCYDYYYCHYCFIDCQDERSPGKGRGKHGRSKSRKRSTSPPPWPRFRANPYCDDARTIFKDPEEDEDALSTAWPEPESLVESSWLEPGYVSEDDGPAPKPESYLDDDRFSAANFPASAALPWRKGVKLQYILNTMGRLDVTCTLKDEEAFVAGIPKIPINVEPLLRYLAYKSKRLDARTYRLALSTCTVWRTSPSKSVARRLRYYISLTFHDYISRRARRYLSREYWKMAKHEAMPYV